jgi:hypothetical protein
VAYPGIFFWWGSTNSVEDRGQREHGSGLVAPWSGVLLNLQMSETSILIRLLQMYLPQNWEFGSALSTFQNFLGAETLTPPLDLPLRLTTHLCAVPRLKMSGAIPPLPLNVSIVCIGTSLRFLLLPVVNLS